MLLSKHGVPATGDYNSTLDILGAMLSKKHAQHTLYSANKWQPYNYTSKATCIW